MDHPVWEIPIGTHLFAICHSHPTHFALYLLFQYTGTLPSDFYDN